ncbi:MAG TPA: hypothetical protein VFF27_08510 [Bacteroidia bacterium]|jgi:hypothetical protein|nr:hypothetical protein [Bacteroidia bacterium]
MKKIILILSGFLALTVNAQTTYTKDDVLAAKSIHFYGFEISQLKLADNSRMGQDLSKFMVGFNELMIKRYNQKEFEIHLWKGKNNVLTNYTPTQNEIPGINYGKFVVQSCQKLTNDSLTALIKKYELPETKGIGSVLVFKCFDRTTKSIDLSLVFFDIATRTIIYSEDLLSVDKNGYEYMADWKKGAIVAMDRLFKKCRKEFEGYAVAHKKK